MKKLLHYMLLMICLGVLPQVQAELRQGSPQAQSAQAKIQSLLRQLTAERDQLVAANERLKAENDRLQEKLDKQAKKSKAQKTALGKFKESNQKNVERISAMQTKMQDLVIGFRDTVTTLKKVEAQKSATLASLQETEQQLSTCGEYNAKLYEVNLEMLDQYETKGVWSALLQREPVTGLKQVEIERMVAEFSDRMQYLQVTDVNPN